MKTLKIDIVSDVMCPWCIIGYKNLEKALSELHGEINAEISWKPFELNPNMPPEGQDLNEHLTQKYGLTPEQSKDNRQRLIDAGKEADFTFNFDDKRMIINSFDCHRLLAWAATLNKQTELKLALFKAHFSDLVNLNEQSTLLDIVASVGLDTDRAQEILAGGEFFQEVRSQQSDIQQMGITTVPTFIINEQYALTGGQPSAAFVQAFKQITEEEAQQNAE